MNPFDIEDLKEELIENGRKEGYGIVSISIDTKKEIERRVVVDETTHCQLEIIFDSKFTTFDPIEQILGRYGYTVISASSHANVNDLKTFIDSVKTGDGDAVL